MSNHLTELRKVQQLAKRRGYTVIVPPMARAKPGDEDYDPEIAGKYWLSTSGWILPIGTTPAKLELFLETDVAAEICRLRHRCVAIERELDELIAATNFVLIGHETATEAALSDWGEFQDDISDWGGASNRNLIASLIEEHTAVERDMRDELRIHINDADDEDTF